MTGEFGRTLSNVMNSFVPTNMPVYKVSTTHIVNGDKYDFDISEDLLGTQVILSIIPVIKNAIDNGKVLLVDEFDKSIHPYISKYIVELFNDSDINKNSSQLIFNTNDTNLLDLKLLRRDQIWFTEKFRSAQKVVICFR